MPKEDQFIIERPLFIWSFIPFLWIKCRLSYGPFPIENQAPANMTIILQDSGSCYMTQGADNFLDLTLQHPSLEGPGSLKVLPMESVIAIFCLLAKQTDWCYLSWILMGTF